MREGFSPHRRFFHLSPQTMDHDRLLIQFDELVDDGVVHHSKPQVTCIKDHGMEFHFIVADLLIAKSQAETKLQLPSKDSSEMPQRLKCFGPGSDIAFLDPRLVFYTIRGTHYLAYNLFAVFRPQLLLLTIDSYKRQQYPLDVLDITATVDVLQQLNTSGQRYYAFLNCGFASVGASRSHKHIQVLLQPAYFFPDLPEGHVKVPYKYFLFRFQEKTSDFEPPNLFSLYTDMLRQTRVFLGLADEAQETPHSVILTLHWLLVIPRRTIPDLEVSVPNSAGMVGSVWLPRRENIDVWKMLGPTSILARAGIPAD
ncbi:hypothetical protein BCR34DRAFT_244437 [Clohesyomyces aquaticus]|uniref:Uncharacterized protein n=1 Tax=Clohesyomyces aquaticus TaxID=1231657 RepID=A0A1Y1ZUS8_9PLEO|nr:hypothetical protein BCR34DRAFT_244437 [Clohesyomyces aquaticus]